MNVEEFSRPECSFVRINEANWGKISQLVFVNLCEKASISGASVSELAA